MEFASTHRLSMRFLGVGTPDPLQLKVALSRRIEKHWRLIGWGEIKRGKTLEILEP